MVVHVNLQILPYKCSVVQKYSASRTDIPYLAGTVNHVLIDETANITDLYLASGLVCL